MREGRRRRGRRRYNFAWRRSRGDCTNAELIEWLLPVWPDVVSALASGERLVEVF